MDSPLFAVSVGLWEHFGRRLPRSFQAALPTGHKSKVRRRFACVFFATLGCRKCGFVCVVLLLLNLYRVLLLNATEMLRRVIPPIEFQSKTVYSLFQPRCQS